jgi:hypothetical protein
MAARRAQVGACARKQTVVMPSLLNKNSYRRTFRRVPILTGIWAQ